MGICMCTINRPGGCSACNPQLGYVQKFTIPSVPQQVPIFDIEKFLRELDAMQPKPATTHVEPEPEPVVVAPPTLAQLQEHYMNGHQDGYVAGMDHGRKVGFEEGRVHTLRHIEESKALQEPPAEPDICFSEVVFEDAPMGEGVMLVCTECAWNKFIDPDTKVARLKKLMSELQETGHPEKWVYS